MRLRFGAALLVAFALVAAACGGGDAADSPTTTAATTTTTSGATTTTTSAATTTTAADECAIENLALKEPGVLTVATSEPSFPPWVGTVDGEGFDTPESKLGFEAALVYEIANRLGFTDDQVKWVRVGFNEAIAVGPKDFDFNIQQYSITAARDEVVDFSVPYYTTTQALVTFPDSPFANASTVEDLKDAKLGAQIGTTSLDFIEDVIQPTTPPNVYDENVDVEAAMNAGQIDGLVVDLPTAYFVVAVQVPDGIIAGRFEHEAAQPDNYGMLFEEGSALKPCIDRVIEELRADGTLDALVTQWLEQGGGLNVITG